MRILLLEDDKSLSLWIKNGLTEEGHVVEHFVDGNDALVAALTHEFDIYIFDRMVPGLDGLSVLKSIRASKDSKPAIFLTALGEVDDRVEGLEMGADDYLVKPFAFAELSARISALSRRSTPSAQQEVKAILAHGDLKLDLLKRVCTRRGEEIELKAKEFQLLEYFMRRPGRVVTRTMLLEQVWELSFDPTTSVVETHISRLRAKVEKPFGDEIIKTMRGLGYVFGD